MPTYQYECDNCKHTFEVLQSITEKKLKKCPECKRLKLHRLIGSGGSIVFKGNGFYETDYKKKHEPKESPCEKCPASKEAQGSSKKECVLKEK